MKKYWDKAKGLVVGLMVGMGFTVLQAQSALAAYATDVDFTAIETDIAAVGSKIIAFVLVLAAFTIIVRLLRRNAR